MDTIFNHHLNISFQVDQMLSQQIASNSQNFQIRGRRYGSPFNARRKRYKSNRPGMKIGYILLILT
jgi:hypothetical protein